MSWTQAESRFVLYSSGVIRVGVTGELWPVREAVALLSFRLTVRGRLAQARCALGFQQQVGGWVGF